MRRAFALGIVVLAGCNAVFGLEPPPGEVTWVSDEDGDGWGKAYSGPVVPDTIVTVPADRVGDCHDDDPDAFPGSTVREVPFDGIDTDCDGNDFCTDLNCDGRPDVVIPSHHDGDYDVTQAARLLSTPAGWRLDPTPVQTQGTYGAAVADLDKDGYPDVVHASYHDGASYSTTSFVYWGRDDHGVASRTALPTHGATWVCVDDLDRNGWPDLVFPNHFDGDHATSSYVYWNRAGSFSPVDRLELETIGPSYCTISDLDGDGELDLVFSGEVSGDPNMIGPAAFQSTAYLYWGSADHAYATRTELPTVGAHTHSVADLDGDGRKEVVFWAHFDGYVHPSSNTFIYWHRATGFSAGDRTALYGMGGYRGAIADLDGDAYPDVIVPGYHINGWATVAQTMIYWGNAEASYGDANRTALSLQGVMDVHVDDLDGDGRTDLLLASHHNGNSYTPSAVFWGTPGGTYSDGNRTELFGYQATLGINATDFDGDGYKDVFVPGYHNMGWQNPAYSRIYWGGPDRYSPTRFDEWATRGTWSAVIVGR